MADPGTPKYLSQIVIDSTNKGFRISTNTDAGNDVTITEGTYFVIGSGISPDLLLEMKTQFEAVGTTPVWTIGLNSSNQLTISCDDGWSVFWDHASTTFPKALLGVASASGGATWSESGGNTVTAEYQHQRGWYGTQAVEWDDGNQYEGNSTVRRAPSGKIHSHKPGQDFIVRGPRHRLEPVQKAQATSGYTNQDWQTFALTANAGEWVKYYKDASSNTDFLDAVFSQTLQNNPKVVRAFHGVSLWGWDVPLFKYIA